MKTFTICLLLSRIRRLLTWRCLLNTELMSHLLSPWDSNSRPLLFLEYINSCTITGSNALPTVAKGYSTTDFKSLRLLCARFLPWLIDWFIIVGIEPNYHPILFNKLLRFRLCCLPCGCISLSKLGYEHLIIITLVYRDVVYPFRN